MMGMSGSFLMVLLFLIFMLSIDNDHRHRAFGHSDEILVEKRDQGLIKRLKPIHEMNTDDVPAPYYPRPQNVIIQLTVRKLATRRGLHHNQEMILHGKAAATASKTRVTKKTKHGRKRSLKHHVEKDQKRNVDDQFMASTEDYNGVPKSHPPRNN